MRTRRLSALIVIGTLVASCESSSPTEPTLDVDLTVVEVMTGGISAYSTAGTGVMAIGGYAPFLKAVYPSSCAYDAATQFFVCPEAVVFGLKTNRRFRLFDASGATLSTTNAAAVASIRVINEVDGITIANAQVTRHEDFTLGGIQSTNRTLNGFTTDRITEFYGGQSVVTNDTTVTSDLQLLNSMTQKYPIGGLITSQGTRSYGGGAPVKYHREVAFDGTSVVTIRFTEGNQTMTCKFDMAATSGSPVSCTY